VNFFETQRIFFSYFHTCLILTNYWELMEHKATINMAFYTVLHY